LEIVPDGTVGLLEFVCPLPQSYPGIAVLLDDMGRIVARDADSDGWQGTGFEIVGRAERAETRGCGDTMPDLPPPKSEGQARYSQPNPGWPAQ
jgi:hypothetical protein